MIPLSMIVTASISVLFITLGTGANAAFKTTDNSSAIAMKFACFMAVSYFCFYYIGAWITKYLLDMMPAQEMRIIASSILFFAVAVKTIWNVFSYKSEDNVYNLSKTSIQVLLSIAGGFNALLVSVALTFFLASKFAQVPVLKTALIITLGAFAGSMSGAKLSENAAKIVTKLRPALLGGVILLALAVYLFI